MTDKDPKVRSFAAMTLENVIGPGAKTAVPALVKQLQDESKWIRADAGLVLARIGPPAVLPVTQLLNNGDRRFALSPSRPWALALRPSRRFWLSSHCFGTKIRWSATRLLFRSARLGLPQVPQAPLLRHFLKNEDWTLRLHATRPWEKLALGQRWQFLNWSSCSGTEILTFARPLAEAWERFGSKARVAIPILH